MCGTYLLVVLAPLENSLPGWKIRKAYEDILILPVLGLWSIFPPRRAKALGGDDASFFKLKYPFRTYTK